MKQIRNQIKFKKKLSISGLYSFPKINLKKKQVHVGLKILEAIIFTQSVISHFCGV